MRRWYQNITIDGVEATFEDPGRKESKFWNEGKWNNFIKPLLPKGRRTFIEIGCNAGLFLKMATDEGFENVIGIEGSKSIMEQAEAFRKTNGGTYRLIRQQIGWDFDLDSLPLADVVLLSNVHYYFPIPVFANLVDRLKTRTLYCIVVSARVRKRPGNTVHHLEAPGLRGYFRDWQEIRVVGDWQGVETTGGDPAPRKQMYGVLFKGGLDVLDVKEICDRWYREAAKSNKYNHSGLPPALAEFFKKILAREAFDLEKTLLYQYWRSKPRGTAQVDKKKLTYKKSLTEDILANGMKEPVYIDRKGKILDGIHRLALAKEMGHKYIIIRRI